MRQFSQSRLLPWISWAILTAAGCSGSAGPGLLPNEKLPLIDEATQLTVDDGRAVVASPKGWIRAPKSKEYLVRYHRGTKKPYPAVTLTVDDPPSGVKSVGKGDHAAFVEAMAASLAERFTKDGKSSLTLAPTAVELGDHFAVAWSAPGKAKNGKANESIDRFNYSLVLDGRLYTVEARGLRKKLGPDGILAAKAVATALSTKKAAVPEPAVPEPAVPEPAVPEPAVPEPADKSDADAPKTAKPDAAKSDSEKPNSPQSETDKPDAKKEPAADNQSLAGEARAGSV